MPTPTPDDELARGIARFWSHDGQVTGTGFLIAEDTLCTCAHVVANALGVPDTAETPPAASVTVDFPLLTPPSARFQATVTHWRPVAGDGGGDVALLSLSSLVVPGTTPVRFAGGTAVWDHPFRVLGFPLLTDDHGVWVDGRLRAPVGKGWTSMEPRGRTIGRGFSGGPVWDTEQSGVVGMTVAADTGTGASTAYLIPAALLLGLEPGLRPSPFRGLEPFREQDATLFFARRSDSERIASALREHPFVPVAGASGVGKSSLVRAGVLPLLRSAGHTVTDFAGQPDTDPVRTLAEALGGQFPPVRELARTLGQDGSAATLLGARILEESGPAGHVILLDQFEETVGARPADARALLDVLLPMARAAHPEGRHLRVLATLRSASLEELVTGGRAEALSGTVQMVAPMTPSQLDEVVRRPIDAIPGMEFEPGLPELLVAEAGGEPGALPLVEFTLAELWDRREHGRLTHAAYREIGGVEGALSRYADQQLAQVCKPPDGPDEATARRLFERLARPVRGKEYARVARAFNQLPPELRTAAQVLAATRLLVISRDSSGRETVALAHEALVRQWPTLRRWLDESRVFLTWHEKLRGRLREWEDSGRHDDLLLRGQELATARATSALRPTELSASEEEFIRRSRAYQRRSVRRGRTGVALVACLALVAGLLGYGLWAMLRNQGQGEKDDAARELVELAADRALDDPVGAALLATAAHHTSPLPVAKEALLRHAWPLASLVSAHRILPKGKLADVAASADGRVMAVLKGDEGHVVTGLDRGEPTRWPLLGAPASMNALAVSDDGTTVAGAAADGEVRVWRLDGGKPDTNPQRWSWRTDNRADVTVTLDFSSDGRRLVHQVGETRGDAMACGKGSLRLWVRVFEVDRKSEQDDGAVPPDGLLPPGECLYEVVMRPAEPDRLTVSSIVQTPEDASSGSVRSVALSTGKSEQGPQNVENVVFAAGGRAVATQRESQWSWQLTAGQTAKRWSDFGGVDASGRYLIANEPDYGDEGDTDALNWVARDLVTQARYSVSLPKVLADSPSDTVVTRIDKQRVVYGVLGRDVVAFGLSPEESYPLGEDGTVDVEDMDRAGERDTLVALARVRVTGKDGYSEPVDSEVVLSAGELQRHQVDRDESLAEIVVSEDGRSFIAWGDAAWDMRTTAGSRYVKGKPAPLGADGKGPDTDSGIESVRPFGRTGFLLLDGKGLARIDGSGLLRRLPEVRCAPDAAPRGEACVTAVGRPDAPGQFLVLRANGSAELWREANGRAELVDDCDFPALAEEITGKDEAEVHFRPDGRAVAVLTEGGVSVWRLDERKPEQLDVEANEILAYGGQGHLVLAGAGNSQLWNDDGRGEPLPLHTGAQVMTWMFDGHQLRGETSLGPLTYDLDFLTGRATTHDFCDALPDRLPGVWEDLLDTVAIPSAAHKDPPCPDDR